MSKKQKKKYSLYIFKNDYFMFSKNDIKIDFIKVKKLLLKFKEHLELINYTLSRNKRRIKN